MSWLRRMVTPEPVESWCDQVDPEDMRGYEGAVSLVPCAAQPGIHAVTFAERIDVLLAGVSVSHIPLLDRSIRDRSAWSGNWFGQKSLPAVLPEHLPEHEGLFLCLALSHPSGYVRQAAIRKVATRIQQSIFGTHTALAMPLLVLRRDDWVAQVADEAAKALDQLLIEGPAQSWVLALPFVSQLADFVRRDHTDFVERVHAAARCAAWNHALLEGIRSSDRHVARSATLLALRSASLPYSDVVDVALAAPDTVVRLVAARAAAEMEGTAQSEALVARLEADVFMPIRRESLRLRASWFPKTLDAAHRRFLFDPSRALRAQAQTAITSSGAELAEYYRVRLRDTGSTDAATALLGLSEVGQESDAHLAKRFTNAPRARCRAAAIRCLARLDGDRCVETFFDALGDPSRLVCRAGAAGLRGRLHLVGIGRVLALLDDAPHKHMRRVVLRLLFENDPWAPLARLVRCAADDTDDDEAQWAASLLHTWFAKHPGWTSHPPKARVDAFRSALDDCGAKLDDGLRSGLEFLLRSLAKD